MDSSDRFPVSETPPHPPVRRDALTIGRILLLMAGVAVSITVFGAEREKVLPVVNSAVIGLSLPAPLFVLAARRRQVALGPASLMAMALGIGALLLLPPAAAVLILSGKSTAPMCLYYVMPQLSLWFLLAGLLTGQINRRLFDRLQTPWVERYGYFLALLWSPLGIFHLVNFYTEALLDKTFEW